MNSSCKCIYLQFAYDFFEDLLQQKQLESQISAGDRDSFICF